MIVLTKRDAKRKVFKATLKRRKERLAMGIAFLVYVSTLFRSSDRIFMAITAYEPIITTIDAKSIRLNMFSPFLLVDRCM